MLISTASATAQEQTPNSTDSTLNLLSEDQLEGQTYAPDFPEGLEWLNTNQPISLEQLRGKIVLIDFWTFCCINCMHVLPELKRLEQKYAEEIVVIGVHSAKFTNEKDSEAIRQAILRYEITHPVVNDNNFKIWQEYGIKAWPTFVLINPAGRVIGIHSGEGIYDLFDGVIAQTIKYFDESKQLSRRTMNFNTEIMKKERSLLDYPGKITADSSGTHLYFSDSNHNRILGTTTSGKIELVIGSGMSGNQDGSFSEARFNRPQGVALAGDILYIADTENHTIRAANLATKQVKTIFGTGHQSRGDNVDGAGTSVALNSPWDLLVKEGKLFIAMAGSHQIWVADLQTDTAKPFAGSGQEARIDGPLLESALAQPSGITTDGKKLYFADSEVSSIRSADLTSDGSVATIVGKDLFEYGDIDGDSETARLQHPLGVVYHNGLLYVADTYNHKIKIVDQVKNTSATFAGSGKRGFKDGALALAEFNEPSGLAFVGERLYVADCNNHQIRVIDTKTQQVSTLQLSNLGLLARQTMDTYTGREIKLQPNKLKPGAGKISFALVLPDGYKLNEQAPFFLDLKSSDSKVVSFTAAPKDITLNKTTGEFEIPVSGTSGSAEVTVETVVYFCKAGETTCLFDMIRARVPITFDATGPAMFGVAVNVRALPRP